MDWLVHREASEPSAADREAFQHWLDQDASHRGAWERVNSALAAPLQTIRTLQPQTEGQPVNAALQTLFKTRRRRVLRGALGVAGVTAASAFVAHRWAPLGQVMADLRTGTGSGARSPSPMARPCCWMLAPPLMCATWRTCPVCSTRQAH